MTTAYSLVLRVDGQPTTSEQTPAEVCEQIWATTANGAGLPAGTVLHGSATHGGREYYWEITLRQVGPQREDEARVLPEWMRTPTGC